jgi:lipopolysaccharide/colanic/teichoic acid biosynthesis glycosyltransferase
LRRFSLNELPQLINVLRGEMSLVGPRRLQLRDSDRLWALDPEGYESRHQAMPGITGPWRFGGRSDVDYKLMLQLALDYIENRSLNRDLWIIGKTFFVMLLHRGAH